MKFYVLVAAMLMSAAVITSCQKDDMDFTGEIQPELKAFMALPSGYDCTQYCIMEGSGDYFVKQYSQNYTGNNGTVTIDVYNTETELKYVITSAAGMRQIVVGGSTVYSSSPPAAAATTFTHTVTLGDFGDDWQACQTKTDEIVVNRTGAGSGGAVQRTFNSSYDLIGICDCTERFTWKDNGDDTYTFTYVTEEDVEGAFLEFTFPQGVVLSAPSGWNPPGNSLTSVVRQKTDDITGCVPYVFTFGLVHADNGQGPLWTDFKVNGVTKN